MPAMITSELTILIYILFSLSISILNLKMLADSRKSSLIKLSDNKSDDPKMAPDRFSVNCQKYYLTAREMEILKLLSTGMPYKIIADELHISVKTVKSHVLNMFQKTNATNKMELVSRINIG